MKICLLLLTLAVGATGSLQAQHGHMMPSRPAPSRPSAQPAMSMDHMSMPMAGMGSALNMDSMMAPESPVLAFAPARVLERAAALQLDDDQQVRLTRLAAATEATQDSVTMAAHHHHHAFAAAVADMNDPQAVAEHFQAMHDAITFAHTAQLKAALDARAVLTPGQRTRIENPQP